MVDTRLEKQQGTTFYVNGVRIDVRRMGQFLAVYVEGDVKDVVEVKEKEHAATV